MTDEQVKQVAAAYQARLSKEGYQPVQIDFDRTTAAFPRSRQLEHVAWACREIPAVLASGDRDHAMRLLGFAQGVLWALGVYAVAEMREQNRATAPF
jgi:hypothetical protein